MLHKSALHCSSPGLFKASKTAQEGHPGGQHGPTCLQDGSKHAQDGAMTAQYCLKRAESIPLDGFRRLHEEPPESTMQQQPLVSLRFVVDSWILTFLGFHQLKTALAASRIAPRRPERAPKRAKRRPKWPHLKNQWGLIDGPRRPNRASSWPMMASGETRNGLRGPLGRPQMAPRRPPDGGKGPKTAKETAETAQQA